MSREENIIVFKETEQACKTNAKLMESVKYSTKNQKLILETDDFPAQKRDIYEKPASIVVSKKRTFEAAREYVGHKTAVLNFASATTPGGGVVNGATAQEECLCRCSGLYFCLDIKEMWNGFYRPHRNSGNPLHNDDIIYTPKVTVFKTDSYRPLEMREELWYDVDVITCAAPKLREKQISDQELLELHEKRLRRILDVAISEGVETIILGAFGCGAYMNNPLIVALANRNVLKDYVYAFKNIVYAVYCSRDNDTNYKVFDQSLSSHRK